MTAAENWAYKTKSHDYSLCLDSFDVVISVGGADFFALAIPLPSGIPVDAKLTIGMGQVRQAVSLAVAEATLREAYVSTHDVVGRYYTPGVEFWLETGEYPVGSLYLDVDAVTQT